MKIAIIGAGNMGGAIIGGIIKNGIANAMQGNINGTIVTAE